MDRKQLEILIIEDNIGDALLVSELLQEIGLSIHITVAKDGRMALDMLTKDVRLDSSKPDFVILDLNLPRVHGFEILASMKATPELRSIPVVVLTGSLNREDEVRARGMGAADYCNKPSTTDEMDMVIGRLKRQLDILLLPDGKMGRQGPLVRSDLSIKKLDMGRVPVMPSRCERSFNDHFCPDPWKTWK